MTPVPVTKPTKTWIATVGAALTVVVPLVTSMLTYLPPEWAAVISGIIGALTVLGVYTVPNKPTGEVVVPETRVAPPVGAHVGGHSLPGVNDQVSAALRDAEANLDKYTNPWQ